MAGRLSSILCAGFAAAALATPAWAESAALVPSGYLNLDLLAPLSGAPGRRLSELDKLHLGVDADLDALAGLSGVTARLSVLNTSGGKPNRRIGVAQGVDNIEADRSRLRLYEAWVERRAGAVSILAGLYDLNSEFYASAPAALLLGPSFGIGPELAATGANGPSIYPSTALTVRAAAETPHGYVRVAALNADARTLGDPGGVDVGFGDGALLIGKAGLQGRGRLGLGMWRYTQAEDEPALDRRSGPAAGVYLLAERPLWGHPGAPGYATGFIRIGVANGAAPGFSRATQFGLLVAPLRSGRPDSALSVGFAGARPAPGGIQRPATEQQFEVTLSDRLGRHLILQPDLQYVRSPGGRRDAPHALAATLRLTIEFGGPP